jgi:tRNA threonylcarbamoyladenosine biosynthesis protein TsaE
MSRLESLEGARAVVRFASDGPDATVEIGRRIGALVPAGTVISLEGGLGAGKTLIAGGICRGLGVADDVLSPSFIIVEEYAGFVPVFHFDLYRLETLDEIDGIGLYDAMDGTRVVIVEWGDRLPAGAVSFDIRVTVRVAGDTARDISIEGSGRFLDALMQQKG